MKFAALALAFLLAVGAQAASLQAEAPTQLQHAREALNVFLTQAKDSAINALNGLDGTDYVSYKAPLVTRIETLFNNIKTAQASVAPYTDSAVKTIADATEGFRTTVQADIAEVRTVLEDHRKNIETVLNNHFQEYQTQLQPLVEEYTKKHKEELGALQEKLTPLGEKIVTNWEETKKTIVPVYDEVYRKVSERVSEGVQAIHPHVEEYREQLKGFVGQVRNVDVGAVQQKAEPLATGIQEKLQQIAELIVEQFNKS